MAKTLHISVNNKVATYTSRDGRIVCGNSDYQLEITFDSDWTDITKKKARFIWNGQYKDVEFSGTKVSVPTITKTKQLIVGIYADNISTTAVVIPCVPSVLCEGGVKG